MSQHRTISVSLAIAMGYATVLANLFLPASALALDPNRALTQCVQRIWQTQQGLPQPTVTCLRQTDHGYLWIGTRKGLVRFDGIQFTTFSDEGNARLAQAWVQDLGEDAQHSLWIATDGDGLIRMRTDEVRHFGRSDGLPSDNVRAVLADKHGRLWAGTDRGLARLDGNRFVAIDARQGLPPFDVRSLCEDSQGEIWVGGEGGRLSRSHGETFLSHSLTQLSPADTIYALAAAADGVLWVGSSNGLVELDGERETRITAADGLPGNVVYCLFVGREQSLYVGTKDGISRLRGHDIESFRVSDGLSQSTVYAIWEDQEGSLWVGTKHGLNQFVDRRTIPFTTREGLPSNNMGPILQDAGGTIWAGTLDAGLARFDGRRFVPLSGDEILGKAVYALADGPGAELWVGTDKGLTRLNDAHRVEAYSSAQGLPSPWVRCLCRDQQGTLWVGTDRGLASFRDGQLHKLESDLMEDRPVLAMVDCQQYLLVSLQDRGVFRLAGDKLERFTPIDTSMADVDAFYRDAAGRVWIGTRGAGLQVLDGNTTHRFTARDGLYDDDIYGIAADDQGRLWMACGNGIFSVWRDDLLKFAAGALKKIETTAFTPLDALRTVECQQDVHPGVRRMDDGRVWFSTIRGLIVVDPERMRRRLPPTRVVIEEMVVNGRREDPQSAHTLGPGNVNVSFQYAALSYASPSRITYRYRLEGFDPDWIEAGSRREAFYTNLAPGTYAFSVVARNADGKEHAIAEPIGFTVEPKFYQTAWFWPACAAAVAAAGWSIYRQRVRQIRERLNAVVAERSRIARELHDTLMQGFSGVTMEMQALASQLPPSTDKNTLVEIIHDAGNCLREARRSVAGLRGDQTGLVASLALAARQLTETSDVRLKLQLDDFPGRLPSDVEYNLLRIAQEGITNAVKHSTARNLEVALDRTPDELRLTISDDGEGFGANGDSTLEAGHYGLIGMRERARQIGAELQLESEPGQGTTVRVVLPLVSSHFKSTA